MSDEESDGAGPAPKEMAEEIVAAVEDVAEEGAEEDGLTRRERAIERRHESERVRRARELRKKLRKRELGLLHYRWPAAVLFLAGVLSVWTEYLPVMVHPEGIGFDSFASAFAEYPNVFFLFPLIAGVMLIVIAFFAYSDPRATFASIIPAMIAVMAGANVYFLVSVGLYANPDVGATDLYATGTPLSMMMVGLLSVLAVVLREKE